MKINRREVMVINDDYICLNTSWITTCYTLDFQKSDKKYF